MKTTTLPFESNEQHMLYGLLAVMYKASEDAEDKGAAWIVIGAKVKNREAVYSEDEVSLLKLAVESTIAAGERMLTRLPEDNVTGRLRAGVVKQTYVNIMEKISNAVYNEREIHQDTEDLRRNDKERATAHDRGVSVASGSPAAPGSSGASSSEP